MILLWKLNDSKEPEQTPVFQEDEDAQLNKESWSVFKTLRYTNVVGLIPTIDLFKTHVVCFLSKKTSLSDTVYINNKKGLFTVAFYNWVLSSTQLDLFWSFHSSCANDKFNILHPNLCNNSCIWQIESRTGIQERHVGTLQQHLWVQQDGYKQPEIFSALWWLTAAWATIVSPLVIWYYRWHWQPDIF